MEITETVRKSVPENEETALSIVKGEIYKSINSRLYNREQAVTLAVREIAKNIHDNGGNKENLYIDWLAEKIIEWVIEERKPDEEWITAIFKHYSGSSLVVIIQKGSPKDNSVIAACAAWNGKRKFSDKTLRKDTGFFFQNYTAPPNIAIVAKALFYEREIAVQRIGAKDCINLAKWAYMQGKNEVLIEGTENIRRKAVIK